MPERLYTDHPELYDAIQSDWDYDRDVAFVAEALERVGKEGDRLLEVGCGTGEHTRRFVARGFDVTAVDPYEGMLSVARKKCDADFRRTALPDLALEGEYDAVVAMRGVVNHLPPEELGPALEALAGCLADGGVLVFDNSPLPPAGNHPALDVGTTERGDYARIAQHVPTDEGRLEWREVVFAPDGEWFVNSREMTPFEDGTLAAALAERGLDAEAHEGYGPGDDRTVFVAVA
jgi:SAM-dependent methyltransferase